MSESTPHEPTPESRFIAADERCPHPERWTSTDGDSTEREVSELVGALASALRPDLVVETGAAFGETTEQLARAVGGSGTVIVALEPDPDRAAFTRARLTAAGAAGWQVEERSSLEWEPSGPIDLLYSDSLYELRVPEFRHFRRWIRRGAIVVFHDTAPGRGAHRIPSGLDLRSEIARELGGDVAVVHLPTPRGIAICEVL